MLPQILIQPIRPRIFNICCGKPHRRIMFRRELDPRFMWERLIEVWVFFHVHAEFRLMYVCWNAGLSIGR